MTIRDVAQEAGVSTATVSRVLSGRRPVSPDVAQVVLRASDRLGYRVNVVARSLRTQATGTVGMIVPHISNPFFPAIVEGVERELTGDDRQLLLCDSQGSADIEAARLSALLSRQVDGLLIISCDAVTSLSNVQRAAAAVPVVQIDRSVTGCTTDFVGTDNEVGIRLLVDHLIEAGARSFALVSARPTTSPATARLEAYQRVVAATGTAGAERVLLGDFSFEWGTQAGRRLVTGPLPDAVLCGDDVIALGLLGSLRDAGVRVPLDVLVTGYDDIGFAGLSNPGLTTVRQPVSQIGAESARLLRARLTQTDGPTQRRILASTLQVRGSTGRA